MAAFTDTQPAIDSTTVTITNGTSLSPAVDIKGASLQGIIMPAAWTAAGLTFQGSVDGTNFFDIYDTTGTEVSHTVVAAHFVFFPTYNWRAIRYIKIRSGTGGTPVAQGADRIITLVLRLGA